MQGYIILATGPRKYIDMAANLAASLKAMDPSRRVCLVHDADAEVPAMLRPLFDDTACLRPDPLYPNVMNKLRLFDHSPYQQTMFVDADCLLVKKDVDHYWAAASSNFFSITGGRRTEGEWKGVRIEDVLRQEGAAYLIQMNAGVFYFDKSDQARAFFEGLNAFYLRRREFLNIALHRGEKAQTDELYLGVYMGLQGMDCRHVANDAGNSWMVSTWHGMGCRFDPDTGHAVIYKPSRYFSGLPLPLGLRRLSPTFAHFIGLKPNRLYQKLANDFRRRVGCTTPWQPA